MRYDQERPDGTSLRRDPPPAARRDGRLATLHRAAGNQAVAHLLAPLSVQRVVYGDMPAMWGGVLVPPYGEPQVRALVRRDSALSALYDEAAAQLPVVDFVVGHGLSRPEAAVPNPPAQPLFEVRYDPGIPADRDFFAASILHELGHVVAARTYQTHGAAAVDPELSFLNMHLPPGEAVAGSSGLPLNQERSYRRQKAVVERNWLDLVAEFELERAAFPPAVADHVAGRIAYAGSTAHVHNETVLGDLMYYLVARGLTGSRTFRFARRMLREANARRAAPGTDVRVVDRDAWWFQFWKW